jgi:hypothetical protein
MRRRLFTLITRARHDLNEAALELAKADVDDMPNEDTDQELLEGRARVMALEARMDAIEHRSTE